MNRRTFLRTATAGAVVYGVSRPVVAFSADGETNRLKGSLFKLALNSYSFNAPLVAGKMSLDNVIEYCAEHAIEGVDLTGYYFPGYPAVPSDDVIYKLKKK